MAEIKSTRATRKVDLLRQIAVITDSNCQKFRDMSAHLTFLLQAAQTEHPVILQQQVERTLAFMRTCGGWENLSLEVVED